MKENTFLEHEEEGLVLVMLDGTRWRVAAGEHTKSLTWIPTDNVTIEDVGDGSYVITRQSDGDSVTAWPE